MSRKKTFLFFVGLFALFMGIWGNRILWENATIVIDLSPPTVVSSTPEDGQTYSSLDTVSIHLVDYTGVEYASFQDDTCSAFNLSGPFGLTDVTFTGTHPNPPTDSSWHIFQFIYGDSLNPSNIGTTVGQYMIYTQLTGNWYANGVKVTPSSTVYSSSTVVDFKFDKTAGPDDGQITCTMTITSGGSGSMNLVNTAPGTWEGSYDFSSEGTYVVDLVASDGLGSPVTASLIDVGFADSGGIYASKPLSALEWGFVSFGVLALMIAVFHDEKRQR